MVLSLKERTGRGEDNRGTDLHLMNSQATVNGSSLKMCAGTWSLEMPGMGMVKFLCVAFFLCYLHQGQLPVKAERHKKETLLSWNVLSFLRDKRIQLRGNAMGNVPHTNHFGLDWAEEGCPQAKEVMWPLWKSNLSLLQQLGFSTLRSWITN